jgi:hypothetical protein
MPLCICTSNTSTENLSGVGGSKLLGAPLPPWTFTHILHWFLFRLYPLKVAAWCDWLSSSVPKLVHNFFLWVKKTSKLGSYKTPVACSVCSWGVSWHLFLKQFINRGQEIMSQSGRSQIFVCGNYLFHHWTFTQSMHKWLLYYVVVCHVFV